MRNWHRDGFDDRIDNKAKAKQALLEKFKKRPDDSDPEVQKRKAERAAIAAAREERLRHKEAEREAERERLAKEKAEDEVRKAKERELEEEMRRQEEVRKKELRDARYAARKARVRMRKR